jgi:hypothetical protein
MKPCTKHKEYDSFCHECKDILIAHQKKAIDYWKNAWFEQRDATGKMAWEIPNPWYLTKDKQKEFLELAKKLSNKTKGEPIMRPSPVRIHYLRDKRTVQPKTGGFTKGTPLVCLMTLLDRTNDSILYSFATIHPDDVFNKKLANKIVEGRLKTNPFSIKGIPATGHEITKKIMLDIMEYEDSLIEGSKAFIMPQNVRKLAAQWLKTSNMPRVPKSVLNTPGPTVIPIAKEVQHQPSAPTLMPRA